MHVETLNFAVLVGAIVLFIAIASARLATRTGTPALLMYLLIGVVLSELGLAWDHGQSHLDTATLLGYAALAIILAEGGLTTDWSSIRPAMAPAIMLATVGTMLSVAVVTAATHFLLGLPVLTSMLIGGIVSSTDAAAVFSVLRKVPLPSRLSGMLEAESGLNDAPVVILVVALGNLAAGGEQPHPALIALTMLSELAGGAVIGLAIGTLGARILRVVALPASGLYPVAVLALAGLSYGAAATVETSGFIAVYLSALVLGNSELPHAQAVRGFSEGLAWLSQIGLFVLLGLLVDLSVLPGVVLPALAIGTVLLLVARPVSVLVAVPWLQDKWRDWLFLSWAGLRGAVPIILATIPIQVHAPGTDGLFETIFVLVVIFTLVQGPTLPWLARWLKLDAGQTVDLGLEAAPLGALNARVLHAKIGPQSRLHGMEILELRLPEQAKVSLVVRGEESIVPSPGTRLRHGDSLLIIAPLAALRGTETRLRALDQGGRLAQWHHIGQEAPGDGPSRSWHQILERMRTHQRPGNQRPGNQRSDDQRNQRSSSDL